MMTQKIIFPAFKLAFKYCLPIMAGYWFLGTAYGLLMNKSGFEFYWPLLMAMTIFSGSVEFMAVKILQGAFHPLQSLMIALLISARHLFYGISMLDKFKETGWKKPFLIFGMADETFSINYTANIPNDIDRGWFMLWVTVLNYCFWFSGTMIGSFFGQYITVDMCGLDFVMTAMFVAIFMEQWMKDKNHASALCGLALSAICLIIFGAEHFVIPAMISMLVVFLSLRSKFEKKEEAA